VFEGIMLLMQIFQLMCQLLILGGKSMSCLAGFIHLSRQNFLWMHTKEYYK